MEGAPPGRRGFYAAVIQAAGPLGIVAASGMVALATSNGSEGFQRVYWRVPFLLSAILVLIGVYLRRTYDDSIPSGFRDRSPKWHPVWDVLKHWKSAVSVALFVSLAETAYFYLCTIFAIGYGSKTLGMPQRSLATALLVANVVAMITVPLLGALSDRIGRRPLLIGGLVAACIFVYPFFFLLRTGNAWLAGSGIVIAVGFVHPMIFAAEASFLPELFGSRIRQTGTSIGKQLGTVLGGGLAPIAATIILAHSRGSFRPLILYFLVMGIPAIIASLVAQENRAREDTP